MSGSRREFLMTSAAALIAPAAGAQPAEPPPGTPPAFGTAPARGPEVSAVTFAAAEKLLSLELTAAERAQAALNWRSSMATVHERRSGPREVPLATTLAPYSTWNPLLPGHGPIPQRDYFARTGRDPGPLPRADADIAFAPVWKLSRWIE